VHGPFLLFTLDESEFPSKGEAEFNIILFLSTSSSSHHHHYYHYCYRHHHRSWDVTLSFRGETKVVKVSEDTSILEAAEKVCGERSVGNLYCIERLATLIFIVGRGGLVVIR